MQSLQEYNDIGILCLFSNQNTKYTASWNVGMASYIQNYKILKYIMSHWILASKSAVRM